MYDTFEIKVVSREGERIDTFLSTNYTEKSRNFFQKLIDDGKVSVNEKRCISKKYKVKYGDIIRFEIPEIEDISIEAEDIPIDIVYEDEDILIVDKPVGMVVHPAVGNYNNTLVNAIMFHCKDSLSGINGQLRPGIVHRIDKDTSGLLMIAKNDMAHRELASQLEKHSVNRKYKAIVANGFKEDSGRIDKPIGRDKKNRLRQAIDYDNGKRAVTNWRVLERMGRYTLIECKLETGRTHQIRVHMASVNHQLLGDALYGGVNKYGAQGQMLHAYMLGFNHPRTGKYMEFISQLPKHFEEVLDKIRKEI